MADDEVLANRGPLLVAPETSRAKFDEQLRRWHANADVYAGRGWLLLSEGDLTVDIGMLRTLPMSGHQVPVMTVCVRLDYWNFDLWAPSVTFIDPVTRQPAKPVVRATDPVSPHEARDLLIDVHPTTRQPFLCLPGVREYHTHPQHSGDDWLLHRPLRRGDLAVICERVWMLMARNVLGIEFGAKVQQVAVGGQVNAVQEFQFSFVQADPESAQQQLAQAAMQQQMQLMARAAPPVALEGLRAPQRGPGGPEVPGQPRLVEAAGASPQEAAEPTGEGSPHDVAEDGRASLDNEITPDRMKADARGPDTRS